MRHTHPATDVDYPVFSVEASSLAALADTLEPPSPHFVLLVAADTAELEGTAVAACAERLVRAGVSYVCCWGPDAERLHDCFDEADLALNGEATADRLIMSTWHEHESLEEAIWFATHVAEPAPAYVPTTGAVIIATIGHPDWAARARAYLDRGAPGRHEA
jgi:hypothetical protein